MKGAPRKLRKSCSLPTCSKTPGECMHCTCDGRCGQHVAGHCGVRREGNGKSCKREGCARDDSCLHSTRATCCHCRNLVSSSNRSSRKRTRVETTKPLLAAKADSKTDDDGAASPTGVDALLPLSADIFGDFEICEELLAKRQKLDETLEDETDDVEEPKNTDADTSEPQEQPAAAQRPAVRARKALAEYPQWAARRHLSNLVIVVEGVQFNLHKHPMLLESQLLNSKAREAVLTMQAPVPVIQLPLFPGGPQAFEALCVYAYSGELEFTADMAAALFAGVHFLNMGLAVKTQAREYLNSLMRNSSSLSQLVRVTLDAATLADKHDALMVCQELQMECVDAVARVLPLDMGAVKALMALPSELFLQITQEMLATRGPRELAVDTVRQLCIQAELAQNHRDAQEDSSKFETSNTRCLELLSQALTPSGRLAADDEEEDDALFMKMMCDFELEPSVEDDVDVDGSFVDALALEPFAFAGRVSNNRLMAEAFAV